MADDSDQPAVEVDHGQIRQAIFLQYLADLLASGHRLDEGLDRLHEIAHGLAGFGQREILHVHPPDEPVVRIDHEQADAAGATILAQPREHLGDRAGLAEQPCPRVHQAPARSGG